MSPGASVGIVGSETSVNHGTAGISTDTSPECAPPMFDSSNSTYRRMPRTMPDSR